MWIRNISANHGNVFVNSVFKTRGSQETVIARAPTNGGKNYPYCEAVLIDCALSGISPVGWGDVGGDPSNVRYWEYNSTNLSDRKPVDVTRRHPASRQLTLEKDAKIIADYRNPAYVLGGWTPKMAPLILSQPKSIQASPGKTVVFRVKAAAIPEASFQWFKNGKPVRGATHPTLTLENVRLDDAAAYVVAVTNEIGTVTSGKGMLQIRD
jgi:pectinesterase